MTRTVFPTIPPRVDYALTPLGRDLLNPVSALGAWAIRNQPKIARARERFDEICAASSKSPPKPSKTSPSHRTMQTDLVQAAREAGFAHFLLKPVGPERLLDVLRASQPCSPTCVVAACR